MRKSALLALLLLLIVFPAQAHDVQVEVTVAFAYAGDIYITDFSDDPINITNSDSYEIIPAWSPDGEEIAFLATDFYQEQGEAQLKLHVMTLKTGKIRQLAEELDFTSEATLTWSPDGRHIAATLAGIFILDAQSGEHRSLPIECSLCSLNWLADSTGFVFQSLGEIYRIDADGQNFQQITSAPPNTDYPALQPLSNNMAFISGDENFLGIYTLNLDDMAINQVIDVSDYAVYPHYWSPDGQQIAFGVVSVDPDDPNHTVPGGSDVYVINADGTDMRSVTGEGVDGLIGWANDSQHVLYYAGEPGSAGGSYMAVNIFDNTQTLLSGAVMDEMCSYSNCSRMVIRP